MTARHPRYRQPKRVVPLLILALTGSCVARAGTIAQHVEIAIPAGRAIDSVRALAQQTNLNILLSGQLADDVMTNALHGSFTPADAVTQIIAGTPLTFAMADDHTVTWDGHRWGVPREEICARLRGAQVEIERRLDGSHWLRFRNRYLRLRHCPEPAPRAVSPSGLRPPVLTANRLARAYKSAPPNHPWRTFQYGRKPDISTLR